MITDKRKIFIELMTKKGFMPKTIHNYFETMRNESDFDEINRFIISNKNASKEDINYEIMRLYLSSQKINI